MKKNLSRILPRAVIAFHKPTLTEGECSSQKTLGLVNVADQFSCNPDSTRGRNSHPGINPHIGESGSHETLF